MWRKASFWEILYGSVLSLPKQFCLVVLFHASDNTMEHLYAYCKQAIKGYLFHFFLFWHMAGESCHLKPRMKSGSDSYIFCCVTVFQLAQLQVKARRWRKILSPLTRRLGGDQADRLHQPSLPLQLHCRLHHLGNNSNCRQVSYWGNSWFCYLLSSLPVRCILLSVNH